MHHTKRELGALAQNAFETARHGRHFQITHDQSRRSCFLNVGHFSFIDEWFHSHKLLFY